MVLVPDYADASHHPTNALREFGWDVSATSLDAGSSAQPSDSASHT